MPRIGYAPGAFDLFHVGHLNLLREARAHCDFLIAGVASDEVLMHQKGTRPVVSLAERLAIVGNHDTEEVRQFEWASRHVMITLKADGTDVVLFHYPLREWPGFHGGAIHFHGHTHDKLTSCRRAWDCGVDHQGFVPLTYDQIRGRMAALPDYDIPVCQRDEDGVQLE